MGFAVCMGLRQVGHLSGPAYSRRRLNSSSSSYSECSADAARRSGHPFGLDGSAVATAFPAGNDGVDGKCAGEGFEESRGGGAASLAAWCGVS